MKINVYYGGRGLLDDPTLYVLKKMEDVLRELRVNIERFNIYEHKNEIATLPLTFKEADGIPYFFRDGETARQMVFSVRLSSATTRLVVSGSSPRSTHSTDA